ncbi:unnamed protein product [Cuscuta epithymum]|uniref:Uncharacterized protein n=1 Tax=Cuscuta epithymum TaxID=186058 RepID=A0AAV0CY88_9ASTE|nr:unnamed protein product [Cuscuta epithymum]
MTHLAVKVSSSSSCLSPLHLVTVYRHRPSSPFTRFVAMDTGGDGGDCLGLWSEMRRYQGWREGLWMLGRGLASLQRGIGRKTLVIGDSSAESLLQWGHCEW